MPYQLFDRVQETSTTTGTSDFTVAGAVTGFRTFGSVLSTGDTFPGYIEGVDSNGVPTSEWETGIYTYSASNTITRTTVIASSNSNAAVSFSAGTKRVGLGHLASSRNPVVQSVTSSATVTPHFGEDQVNITAQAAALALANPTGTAIPAWGMVIRIKDNGTARAISFDTQYRAINCTLPTTTIVSKTLYLGMEYNSTDTKWDVIVVAQEA